MKKNTLAESTVLMTGVLWGPSDSRGLDLIFSTAFLKDLVRDDCISHSDP